MEAEKATGYEGWAILELMGHRRMSGRLSEQVVGGASFVRIDVPGDGEEWTATQFYAPSAIYCITPTTEAIARKIAASGRPMPVTEWELRPERTLPAASRDDEDDDEQPY